MCIASCCGARYYRRKQMRGGNDGCGGDGLRADRGAGLGSGEGAVLQRRAERRCLPARRRRPGHDGIAEAAGHRRHGAARGRRHRRRRPRHRLVQPHRRSQQGAARQGRDADRGRLQRSHDRQGRPHLCRVGRLPRVRWRAAAARPSARHRPGRLGADGFRRHHADQRHGCLAGRQAALSLGRARRSRPRLRRQ